MSTTKKQNSMEISSRIESNYLLHRHRTQSCLTRQQHLIRSLSRRSLRRHLNNRIEVPSRRRRKSLHRSLKAMNSFLVSNLVNHHRQNGIRPQTLGTLQSMQCTNRHRPFRPHLLALWGIGKFDFDRLRDLIRLVTDYLVD